MAIHRVGSGAGAPPEVPGSGPTDKAGGASGATKPFDVAAGSPSRAGEAAKVTASPTLEAVRRGDLDVNGYVEAKVKESTGHLTTLTPSQRAAIEGVVRSQLLSDPHLRALVEKATGQPLPDE